MSLEFASLDHELRDTPRQARKERQRALASRHPGVFHRIACPPFKREACVVPTPVDWEGVRRHARRS